MVFSEQVTGVIESQSEGGDAFFASRFLLSGGSASSSVTFHGL